VRRCERSLDVLVSLSLSQILRPPGVRLFGVGDSDLDLDFAGFFKGFLFYERDHTLEFVGDLFIA
jgi:hypothetical protein